MASMTKPIEITASHATTRRMTCRFSKSIRQQWSEAVPKMVSLTTWWA
jgi:hypothetical protein